MQKYGCVLSDLGYFLRNTKKISKRGKCPFSDYKIIFIFKKIMRCQFSFSKSEKKSKDEGYHKFDKKQMVGCKMI